MKCVSFLITFWGDRYRFYAERYCFASLFCPLNLDQIKNISDEISFECVICCLTSDWNAFIESEIYQKLCKQIKFIHLGLPIQLNTRLDKQCNMEVMTAGHTKLIDYCLKNQRYGSFIYPECVITENYIALLTSFILSKKNFSFVNYVSPRMCDETIFTKLNPYRDSKTTLSINTFELAKICQNSLHTEIRITDLKQCYELSGYPAFFYKDKASKFSIFHSLCWAPILVNYPAIADKHKELFKMKCFTLDGQYINENSSPEFPILTIQDNLKAMIIGFTDTRYSPYTIFQQKSYNKHFFIWRILKKASTLSQRLQQTDLDKHKKKTFKKPVILFTKPLSPLTRFFVHLKAALYLRTLLYIGKIYRPKPKYLKNKTNIHILSEENFDIAIDSKRLSTSTIYLYDFIQYELTSYDSDSRTKKIKEGHVDVSVINADVLNKEGIDSFETGILLNVQHQEPLSKKTIQQNTFSINWRGEVKYNGTIVHKMNYFKSSDQVGISFSQSRCTLYSNGQKIYSIDIDPCAVIKKYICLKNPITVSQIRLKQFQTDESALLLQRLRWKFAGTI